MGQTFAEQVAAASATLTPTERRLAEVILDDPTVLAFSTVAEIADRVDASGPTIVRFATKLGYDGYSALQQNARRLVREELKRPTDRIRRQPSGDTWAEVRAISTAAIDSVFDKVTPELVGRLASPLANAESRVWIVASENSAAAQVLAGGLHLLRTGVQLVSSAPAAAAGQLADVRRGDTVVSIDFSRYEQRVVRTTNALAADGLTVVAITDSAFSPLTAPADVWCEIAIPAIGPFDSALPAVAVVEVLLAEIANRLATQATARIDRAEALWSANNIFTTP